MFGSVDFVAGCVAAADAEIAPAADVGMGGNDRPGGGNKFDNIFTESKQCNRQLPSIKQTTQQTKQKT